MTILSDRRIIVLSGTDTIALLERTVTNSVSDWQDGEIRFGALLTPQGKIIADFLALRTVDGVWIDTHADAAEDLAKRLKMFRLRSSVSIDVSAGQAVSMDDNGLADPRSALLPKRTYLQTDSSTAEHGHTPPSVSLGIPQWGADYRAAEVFPTDVNLDLLGGIDYKKGCFVGQEVASRMKRRGSVRKRTVGISLTSGAVAPGDIVQSGETKLGEITSVDGDHALARLRIDHLAKMGALEISSEDAKGYVTDSDWLRTEMDGHRADVG